MRGKDVLLIEAWQGRQPCAPGAGEDDDLRDVNSSPIMKGLAEAR